MKPDFTALASQFPTPFYAYDAGKITAQWQALVTAFAGQNASLHYAVKANDNPAIIKLLAAAGGGACLVSSGEMQRALAGGMAPANMLMNGVGKTRTEIEFALAQNIGQLNIESIPEIAVINEVAQSLNVVAPVCLRLNPEVTATTHSHITTARRTDKFGLLVEELPAALAAISAAKNLQLLGYSCHIGSQIHNTAELQAGYVKMVEVFSTTRQPQFDRLDLGGGFAVGYKGEAVASPAEFAALIHTLTKNLQASGVRVQLEPGRFAVAEAGTLVCRVLYVKNSGGTRFVVVDAAMNDLIRPALYGAHHPISLARPSSAAPTPCTIVGPVCESSDCFATARALPSDVQAGDVLLLQLAGAYGYTMGSAYNARARPAEILVGADGAAKQIRRAFTAAEFDALTLVG